MDARQKATDIFLAGVAGVQPATLINRFVSINQNILQIEENRFDLSTIENMYVVGAGKACAAMAKSIEDILGARITAGHIITKYDHSIPLQYIGITEAGHPVPDENGNNGTQLILSMLNRAEKNDLVICLISGGGSALLTDVPEGCTLDDLKLANTLLLQSGAVISEMNCIRKHLSKVKGGQLAKAAYPARLVSLIISDVVGDPLDVIASGPTAPDPTTYSDALSILHKYKIENKVPTKIFQLLRDGADGKRQETIKESDEVWQRTNNLIIGSNQLALVQAKEKAESFGYETRIIANNIEGLIEDVALYFDKIVKTAKHEMSSKKICLLFAGEPTINLKGKGKGGRNQHLALIMATSLDNLPGITFLSAGTDGTDGPTDAAGAIVDSYTSLSAKKLNLNIESYLHDCDSYHFFKQVDGLIITGPTQTNVMDLMVLLIE